MAQPILPGTGATDYERYLRTDDLLSLQKAPAEMAHPDELTFQVVHQSSELMMKAMLQDLDRVRWHIQHDDLRNASRLLRRINLFADHLISLLRLLETLTPYVYHLIRMKLGTGSGLESPGFLGLLRVGPKLNEDFFAALKKAGIELEQLYREHEDRFDLHDLAERLLDFDERVQAFRFGHMKLAERIIGGGVLGTSGAPVDILRQRLPHSMFKELWDVRNQITTRVNDLRDADAQGHGERPRY